LVVTLDDLRAATGMPATEASRTERFQRSNGSLVEWGWRDTVRGGDGWWWAITHGDRVLAIGRAPGDALARGERIRRALARHLQHAAM
jgi:hypothetical protein